MYKDPIDKIKTKVMKLVSWNLLHKSGATVEDIARIIELEKPDLFLMQEATAAIDGLEGFAGGYYQRQDWPSKRHGLATWSNSSLSQARQVALPFSRIPGTFPQRSAQIIDIADITIANVHLSHGQVLNRKQLITIARNTEGPTAIIGDFNAIGPVRLNKFDDVGPRHNTHRAQRLIPFRLDRCMVRELYCREARTLQRGVSDHKPIVVELATHYYA